MLVGTPAKGLWPQTEVHCGCFLMHSSSNINNMKLKAEARKYAETWATESETSQTEHSVNLTFSNQ